MINLREQYKPDMTPVLESIFSHAQVSKKNILVTILIVRLLSLSLSHSAKHPQLRVHLMNNNEMKLKHKFNIKGTALR